MVLTYMSKAAGFIFSSTNVDIKGNVTFGAMNRWQGGGVYFSAGVE